MSFTIVGIPAKDDYVWKVSSEKIPHLTILHLGDDLQNVADVIGFVGHAAKASISNRFGLPVDRRDLLGDKNADVLLFDQKCARDVQEFRGNLLKNRDIFVAYNSTEQFPVWIPHLTLGYPNTPAKPDDRDYPISWVNFDRIAVWTEDYEGPEFLLEDNMLEDIRMSDEALAHFGIKGMHWGKRKARAEAPRAAGYSQAHQQEDRKRFGSGGSDRINERLSKGSTLTVARKAEVSYRRKKTLLIVGAAYAGLMLATHGPGIAQGIANNYVGKKNAATGASAAANLLSDARGIGSHKIVDLGFNAVTGVWG